MSFDEGVLLETERLLLRPFEEADAKDLLAASEDPEIRRWMPWASAQTLQTATDWCTTHAHPDPARAMNFAITRGDRFARAETTGETTGDRRTGGETTGDRLIGSIGLGRTDWTDGRVEVGYWIAPWARRNGYAVEATRGVAAYAFEKGMHRIELLTAVTNLASQGVARKAGFTRECVLREAMLIGSGRVDAVLFSLLASDEF